jgi:NAD(P)-dependent dehydrogenase (short-subunit alcohol dehydrogenase family)
MSFSRYIFLTGASRGLGYGFADFLSSSSDSLVFASCRSPASSTQLNRLANERSNLKVIELDVSDEKSIERAAATVSSLVPRLDILINNAGVASRDHPNDPVQQPDASELARLYQTNLIGPALINKHFVPLLKPKQGEIRSFLPRVVSISSNLGSINNCEWGGVLSYRCSKAALNMLNKCWSLDEPTVLFLALHPGWVATDMGSTNNRKPPVTVEESIQGMNKVIQSAGPELTGKLIDFKGNILPF